MKSISPQPYASHSASVPRRSARHGSASQSSARRHARAATLAVEVSSHAYPSTTRALTPQLADSPLHYSDDDQLQADNLGDLTPTSNRTPSPSSSHYPTHTHHAPHSPQSAVSSTGSDTSSIMSLPPLSIPPRILDALHRELAEKSQLLSLANDHIHHQSVAMQHMQAKLTSYQEANNAMLSANVGSGTGAGGGRSEEVKQLKVLVSHLYNMIAQRDAIVEEQEKELHYYQQFMIKHKQDREKEVEKEREKERERDRERERTKQLELEVLKYKGDRERKDKEEREERKEQERRERDREERESGGMKQEDEGEERKVNRSDVRSPPSGRRVRTSPPPPVPPPPLRTDSPPASTASSVASLAVSSSRASNLTASAPSSSISSPKSDVRNLSVVSPTALAAASFRQSPHGLLPKVRRASPSSASSSSSPTFGSTSAPLTRSATPPLMSLPTAGPPKPQRTSGD